MPARRLISGRQRGGGRHDTAPCPTGNGTQLGSFQQFTLLCGSNVVGDVLDSPDAADFTTCVDLCASFHPKCEAVSFDGKSCILRSNLVADRTHPARAFDAAVGNFPGATSNCPTLGGAQTALGANFGTFCGFIINGNDLSQNFAPTFQDCMGQCATTTGCGAVSFDPSMAQGFKNCYLKGPTDASANIADQGIDTAIVQNNAAVPAPDTSTSSAAPPPTTSSAALPATTTAAPPPSTTPTTSATSITPVTSSVPVPEPVTTGGASFFTPPPSFSAPVSTETVVSVITSVSDTISVTQVFTIPITSNVPFPFPTTSGSLGPSTTDAPPPDSGSNSQAWIAAPVVGSIAALVLIVLTFVMLGKRRSGRRTSKSAISRPSPSSGNNIFSAWLPGSPGRSANRKLGNFSEVTGQKMPARSSVRSSVIGFWRPGLERLEDVEENSMETRNGDEKKRESTPVYDLKAGKIELRNSMNGLGQNRWS